MLGFWQIFFQHIAIETLPVDNIIEVASVMSLSKESGCCQFVYNPPTIDTLVTGMDNVPALSSVPCVTNSEQKWRRALEATFQSVSDGGQAFP